MARTPTPPRRSAHDDLVTALIYAHAVKRRAEDFYRHVDALHTATLRGRRGPLASRDRERLILKASALNACFVAVWPEPPADERVPGALASRTMRHVDPTRLVVPPRR